VSLIVHNTHDARVPPPARKPALNQHLKTIGTRVRELREQRKLSQAAFADRVGIDRTYVSGIERGVRNFGVTLLFDLAKALRVKPEDLLTQ
jgi:transcriptional regulator with XRE-family HTH domain